MYLFNIKNALPTDIPAIQEIISETWEPTYRNIISPAQIHYMQDEIYQYDALLEQMAEGQQFFILYVNKIPAGFASYSHFEGSTYKINKLYVKPGYQGQGFGSLLIRHIEAEAKTRAGKFLILNVNRHNNARKMYENVGFKIIREKDIPIGSYWMNDYILQKEIADD